MANNRCGFLGCAHVRHASRSSIVIARRKTATGGVCDFPDFVSTRF